MNRKNTRYIDKSNAHCGGGTLMCCRHSYTRVGYHTLASALSHPTTTAGAASTALGILARRRSLKMCSRADVVFVVAAGEQKTATLLPLLAALVSSAPVLVEASSLGSR